jgi:flagellar protein FlgJ
VTAARQRLATAFLAIVAILTIPAPAHADPASGAPATADPATADPAATATDDDGGPTVAEPTDRVGPAVAAHVAGPAAGTATVTTDGGALTERSGPTRANARIGTVRPGAKVKIMCQAYGQRVAGKVTTSAYWEMLSNGGYVADAYLSYAPSRPSVPWCGARSRRPVFASVGTAGDPLNVRSRPSSAGDSVGTVPRGAALTVSCRMWGQRVSGAQGTTATWSQLSTGRYVSEAYLHWSPGAPYLPWCGQAPAVVAPRSTAAFIRQSVAAARASQAAWKVPASVTLAQAINESGWGRSTLTRMDHNYFGMKCFGDPGPIALGCRAYATHECGSHGCYATSASFRAYRDGIASFSDHGRLLATLSRYRPAFRYTHEPDNFARAIARAGYATSPVYARNLIALMKRYHLYQYDRPTAAG